MRGLTLLAAGALVMLLGGLLLSGAVTTAGHGIPQSDLETDYMQAIIVAIVLGLGIALWPVGREDKRALANIWIVKIYVTLAFMLFYDYRYGLDAYSYFDLPRHFEFGPDQFEIGNGTNNMFCLVWLAYRILPESYHALKVVCAMVGLVGLYLLYRAAVLFLRRGCSQARSSGRPFWGRIPSHSSESRCSYMALWPRFG